MHEYSKIWHFMLHLIKLDLLEKLCSQILEDVMLQYNGSYMQWIMTLFGSEISLIRRDAYAFLLHKPVTSGDRTPGTEIRFKCILTYCYIHQGAKKFQGIFC